jgi:hypothetical protein
MPVIICVASIYKLVDVRALLAIDFYVDEPSIHHRGDSRVRITD